VKNIHLDIRYIHYWNLQCKLSSSYMGNPRRFWLSCFRSFWFYCSQDLKNILGFPIFRFWAYLMKVIPETHRVN